MSVYLLDTTAFSALMDEEPRTLTRADSLNPDDRLVICTIVRGEVLYGIERLPHGRRRREFEAKAANLFARIPCEGIPEGVADIYARIKRDAERRGTQLDENDLWIAAAAMGLEAIVVSSDTDYQKVNGLRTEDWSE